MEAASILIGKGSGETAPEAHLLLRLANRHGLIAGATGTGKTVTLQGLAEGFSAAGVPVFLADAKGDLAGLAKPGEPVPHFTSRLEAMGQPTDRWTGFPTIFWDIFGKQGHPVRVTVSEIGPVLLSRLLNLNDVQTGVLNLVFKLADDEGLLLLDLKDLRAVLVHVSERARELQAVYGTVSAASVGAIQRALLTLENEGGDALLGEPALELADMMRVAPDGRGAINILAADVLLNKPRLYGTFLVWLLAELFEELPEAGDLDKPKMVLFFDEAHLLFNDAPTALVDKIEQVVRLIRSKGVGVYFVTQNPLDIPETVLGQLGNRVQHALRAFTPRDQRAVKAAAETFRPNPALNTAQTIMEVGVGEALVSCLDRKGAPNMVERILIKPPVSRVGPLADEERAALMKTSPVTGKYDQTVDRYSAYERLAERASQPADSFTPTPVDPWRSGNGTGATTGTNNPWGIPLPPPGGAPQPPVPRTPVPRPASRIPTGRAPAPPPAPTRTKAEPRPAGRQPQSIAEKVMGTVVREIGTQVGRQLVRGILGALTRK